MKKLAENLIKVAKKHKKIELKHLFVLFVLCTILKPLIWTADAAKMPTYSRPQAFVQKCLMSESR